ncbi:DUF1643 domain-containing protein [Corallococcus exiguus]|uniref:DUF1643 domain-containing protein n=1 Tax=Corallococcus exiguus TaxID=83462 RepID=UPI0015609329|nr:DUF1643 domain-containing protein [Corallococcus exiguus]NRD64768.1 DUF1643 domain-containing protein [Corallococcus exiguus]
MKLVKINLREPPRDGLRQPCAATGSSPHSAISSKVRRLLGRGAPDVIFADDDFPDAQHRIRLEFWWDRRLPPLIAIGQNPSKASRDRSDPTVTRCARRAHLLGLGGLVMLNLFAYVATHPSDLWASKRNDAIEAKNLAEIRRMLEAHPAAEVLFAPGWDKEPAHRAMAAVVEEIVRGKGRKLQCLGTTAKGFPRHPSRCGYDVGLVEWNGRLRP